MNRVVQFLSLKPEIVFLFLASIFGLTYLFIIPPIQSPDENRHFYRAYHMSQGSFFAVKEDGRVGGYLPKKIKQSFSHFTELRGRTDLKTSRKELEEVTSRKGDDTMEFVDFPSVAVYTPISYLPQAVGIRISRLFSDSVIVALYGGRLASLFIWILTLFFAIRITPVFKWLFVALALLPMSVYIHATVSADVVTNALVFLLLSSLLKHAFTTNKQTQKQFVWLLILSALLASAKFLYTPILLLFLIIPVERFKSRNQKIFRFGMLAVIVGLVTVCWPIIQGVGYVPYADYSPEFREKVNLLKCSNIHEQLAYILANGSYVFVAIGNSIVGSFDVYAKGFIGSFGLGEVSMPSFWLCFAYIGLFTIPFLEGVPVSITKWQRFTFVSTSIMMFCIVILSQLLIWTCVGDELVTNLQGRYIIPIVPIILFAFYRFRSKSQKWLPIGVTLFSIMLLITSTSIIYDRFYVPIEYKTEIIYCDHETITEQNDFETSVPNINAQNGFSRSQEKARSGIYSSKLSHSVPYGTLIRLEHCNEGDIIKVRAWRNGPNGMLVISSDQGSKLYQASAKVANSDSEWQELNYSVIVPLGLEDENISCYFSYFESVDSCYFDDVQVTLKRAQ